MSIPIEISNLIKKNKWLEYIPIIKTAKLKRIAELYEEYGDMELDIYTSAHYYICSAEYFTESNQLYRSAVLRMKASQKFRDLGQIHNSNMHYLVASDIFKNIRKEDCYIICISKIANNCWDIGEYASAIKHFEMCIKINLSLGKPEANIEFMDCIGTILSVHLGKYNLAITMYDKIANLSADSRFIYIGGLLRILAGVGLKEYFTRVPASFIHTYYGEYLILLAQNLVNAATMYEVYKDLIGRCDLLDILLVKISDSKI